MIENKKITKRNFKKFLKTIPKAEIHLHSEALISRKTVSDILSRKDPKYKEKEIINELFSYNNLEGFIETFLLIQSAFDDMSDFKNLFSNILPYLKRNGIVYSELFFSPSNFIKNGLDFEDMINIFIDVINYIKEREKLDIKIIVDVSRTFGIENAERNLNATLHCRCDNIIGIGLGGDEKKGPAKSFKNVFLRAKDHGLHRVAHAGEDAGPYSIWDAIHKLSAERIGHGISCIEDDELVAYLVEKQIPLEVCPTSNIFTKRYVSKMKNHPIKSLFDKGALVTLNTDDPTFFNIELLDEYWNMYKHLHFSLNDIKQLIINSFKASFIPENKKDEYIKTVKKTWRDNISLLNE